MTEHKNTTGAIGIIPARWGSTRFPGKALAEIAGKPMIRRTAERAVLSTRLDRVIVATDDERIAKAVCAIGRDDITVAMTRADHPSGTDRVAEAAAMFEADTVINIQGDEPLIEPALIDRLVEAMESGDWDMATAATPIGDPAEVEDPSVVKAVFGVEGRALYFSRSAIPHNRDGGFAEGMYWRHIGIYAYCRDYLLKLVAEPPCALEELEKLEQLRALHLGCRMKVVQTEDFGIGVDTPEDIAKAEALLSAKNS